MVGSAAMIAVLLTPTPSIARHDASSTITARAAKELRVVSADQTRVSSVGDIVRRSAVGDNHLSGGSAMSKVIVEASGPVRTIWMNRPEKRNALDREMRSQMTDALGAPVAADDRVVVIRGKGA